jgi:hypothetical protein
MCDMDVGAQLDVIATTQSTIDKIESALLDAMYRRTGATALNG